MTIASVDVQVERDLHSSGAKIICRNQFDDDVTVSLVADEVLDLAEKLNNIQISPRSYEGRELTDRETLVQASRYLLQSKLERREGRNKLDDSLVDVHLENDYSDELQVSISRGTDQSTTTFKLMGMGVLDNFQAQINTLADDLLNDNLKDFRHVADVNGERNVERDRGQILNRAAGIVQDLGGVCEVGRERIEKKSKAIANSADYGRPFGL